jgi:2,3-bisphosphoglycerate-independent phosphoglycerate mutase
MKRAQDGRQLHLFGLVSDGGVHSHQEHLYALLRTAREYGLTRVFVHAFMDGRDTPPCSGAGYIAQLEQKMREYGVGKVATRQRPLLRHGPRQALGARAQGLRRHGHGQGRGRRVSRCGGAHEGVLTTTASPTSLSFPLWSWMAAGKPVAQIRDEDVCINFNFRADRAREITRVLTRESGLNKQGGRDLDGWEALDATIPRSEIPKNLYYLCMTQYDKLYDCR